jgi:pimeloyl-ACP methyl ester carboxylesterase
MGAAGAKRRAPQVPGAERRASVIELGAELAGRGVGIAAGALAAALKLPGHVLGPPHRVDRDIGRLGPLPFDEARHVRTRDGGDVFTTAHGHGPTFLFVHGFALTSRIWTKQFHILPRAGIRAVAFDHRGHGASTASIVDTSIETLADDVRAVVEELHLRDVVLVGHSMGGMALLSFALRHPGVFSERVRGLVLVSSSAKLELARVPVLSSALAPFVSGFVRSGAWARGDWSAFAARFMFGRDPQPSQVELVRVLLASAREETVTGCARAMTQFDVLAELSAITARTLVISGTADLFTTPRDARRLARGLRNARLETIAGAGHMLMLERGEHFGALLSGFARELGVAAGLAA